MALSGGLLNLDKPYGMTSFHAVQALKRTFGWQRIGHAGTLDPLATGVLPVCIGKATRFIPFLVECSKGYQALIRLGADTETQDREGPVCQVYRGTKYPSLQRVKEVLAVFIGETLQVPPMYSAIRCNGKRLYELAREGKHVPRTPRTVHISEIRCLAYQYPFLFIDVSCSKGTYIRTLAADIGERLGTGAHLWALKRLCAGGQGIDAALPLEEVIAMDPCRVEEVLVPMEEILPFLPMIFVNETDSDAMLHGRNFSVHIPDHFLMKGYGGTVRIKDLAQGFLGLGQIKKISGDAALIKPSIVLT